MNEHPFNFDGTEAQSESYTIPEFGMTTHDLAQYTAKRYAEAGVTHYNMTFVEEAVQRIKAGGESDFQDFEVRPVEELWAKAREELVDVANYMTTLELRLVRYLEARGLKKQTEVMTSAVVLSQLAEMTDLVAKAHHDMGVLESAINAFDLDIEGIE